MISSTNGIEFEKIVADIQSQLDPNSFVTHNERIVDRLGQARQFDVVIRGKLGGIEIFGVVECRDKKRKVDTPQIDAFITKCGDINTNFKIFVSRSGFTKNAIDKARYYGVGTYSVYQQGNKNAGIFIGAKFYANRYWWKNISASLLLSSSIDEEILLIPEMLKISGKSVMNWFTNYLLDNHNKYTQSGEIVRVKIDFIKSIDVEVSENRFVNCIGIVFCAERYIDHKERMVGAKSDGFYDYQKQEAKMIGGDINLIPASFVWSEWQDSKENALEEGVMFELEVDLLMNQFERSGDFCNLDVL